MKMKQKYPTIGSFHNSSIKDSTQGLIQESHKICMKEKMSNFSKNIEKHFQTSHYLPNKFFLNA